ncbi:hypothetical protein E2562_023376 [Oryza meyeriana var. granulata]|uniref:Uncharacterized protein n=1 Tax=Oryza meyeriana var. granulata TaxID=110450 RepID=A0A6G1E1D8_9ORYZ|nr:hypothetical protein E2562_023376 [Oryza meyeriana var. granulata]
MSKTSALDLASGLGGKIRKDQVKYVGDEEQQTGLQMTGLNLMDKTLAVRGARITFSIWDVAGDSQFLDHVPIKQGRKRKKIETKLLL